MSKYKREDKDLYLNPLATTSKKGRLKPEAPDDFRSEFQRDIHRILYSQSFRRLRHKTQVFYFPRNDHVSTRLDHVLFVASASRTVARCLNLNEDLAEAIGLAHDIGHAPFGHQGEEILQKIINDDKYPALKKVLPTFHHELYGLRVVDKIAKRDRQQPGLNLTWEVRDGIVSHCGEDKKTCKLCPETKEGVILEKITSRSEAGMPSTLEGCIVRLVDKVAYAGKDIEDALATGVIKKKCVPPEIISKLGKTNGQIVGKFLKNIIIESHGRDFIGMSRGYGLLLEMMLDFNYKYIYKSPESGGYRGQAEHTITLLYKDLLEECKGTKRFTKNKANKNTPNVHAVLRQYVTEDMKDVYGLDDPDELIVLDFIAGMTDNYAVRCFQERFVPQASV